MMKPHIEQKQKTILGLKVKPTLKFAAYGLCFAIVGCIAVFMYQMTGNNENALAHSGKKFRFLLFPDKQKGEVAPAVEVSTCNDSLIIDFMNVDEDEVRSAVLNMRDFNSSEENPSQVRTFTLQYAHKTASGYRFSIPSDQLPKKIFLTAKISLLNNNRQVEEAESKVQLTIDRAGISAEAIQ